MVSRRRWRSNARKIVAVYEDDFNFLSKMCLTRMSEVAWQMAKEARAIGAITIVHGSDSTDSPLLFLENGFDYVCCGEAEETLVQTMSVNSAKRRDSRPSMAWCGLMARSNGSQPAAACQESELA